MAGVINGDKLVQVVGYAAAPMSGEQRARYEAATRAKGKRGATLSQRGQPNCNCGGKVECNPASLFLRRFYPGDPSCRCCLEFVVREVAVVLAGGTATRIVMQAEPSPLELREDGNAESTFLIEFDEKQRAKIRAQARSLAERWIQEEQTAVLALTDALLVSGVLNGPDAEHIIRTSLSGKGVGL